MTVLAPRREMVRRQLFERGVRSRAVLRAFLAVDRKIFAGGGSASEAYGDHPVSIGLGQTVSQPYMVALMLEALEVRPGMRVLEVGAGSGYAMALLASMGARPFGVERIPELAEGIAGRLEASGFGSLPVLCGDGGLGWTEEAPFDRILVSAACPEIPPPLLGQLVPGGILVGPVGGRYGQELVRMRSVPGAGALESRGGCVFVPLRGRYGF